MSVTLFAACAAAAALAANPAAYNLPSTPAAKTVAKAAAPDPNVSHTYLGEVTGTVVKVGDGSITLSVPEVVKAAGTQKMPTPHLGGRGRRTAPIAVPKTTTKLVEVTYDLGDTVSVKTVTGKPMTLTDVTVGSAARVHVERLREQKLGEKTEPHVVVKTIDIPTPTAVPVPAKK